MARKSTASLAVSSIGEHARLKPPDSLSDEEKALWNSVTATKPPEWFRSDSAPLLTEYCRSAVMCNELDLRVRDALSEGTARVIKETLDMRDKESRRMALLATKMRLTQQARYCPDKASVHDKKTSTNKPWQTG